MFQKSSHYALAGIVALLGTTLITPYAQSDTPTGKQLYQADCLSCHGAAGVGGKKIGNSTSADMRWSALGPMYGNDLGLVRRAILDGMNEDNEPLDAEMPRWKDKLSATQADAIIAYLQTLK